MTAVPIPALPDPDDMFPDHPDVELEAQRLQALADEAAVDIDDALANAPDDAWRITDDNAAEWAMGKLADAEAQLSHLADQRAEYVQRADQWLDRVAARPLRDAAFFRAHLSVYAQQRRTESGGKVKTLRLPSGEVATRTQGKPRPRIVDAGVVLTWALEQRDRGQAGLVRSQLVLDVLVTALAPHVDIVDDQVIYRATGEVVPGTTATATPPSATPKPYQT